eukprot:3717262-Pleurochrysis_carterae.AAC.1
MNRIPAKSAVSLSSTRTAMEELPTEKVNFPSLLSSCPMASKFGASSCSKPARSTLNLLPRQVVAKRSRIEMQTPESS